MYMHAHKHAGTRMPTPPEKPLQEALPPPGAMPYHGDSQPGSAMPEEQTAPRKNSQGSSSRLASHPPRANRCGVRAARPLKHAHCDTDPTRLWQSSEQRERGAETTAA